MVGRKARFGASGGRPAGSNSRKEESVSEEETILSTEDEDVEAHGKKSKVLASDEPRDETESDDDVELHGGKSRKAM
jgi:hypothetical protein